MKTIPIIIAVLCTLSVAAQVKYETPTNEPLPEPLRGLPRLIQVSNFPKKINAVNIDGNYYWKHNTAILCEESEVEIIEFGAYLFYNGKWNLRRRYPLKDLNKQFGTKKQVLAQAQPYTWSDNWRVGPKLFGGWAMWYFIGKTTTGERVCGYQKIETTATLLN